MVGRYGEVILMDWGIAKQTRGESIVPNAPTAAGTGGPANSERLFTTRNDQFIGTDQQN